MLTGSPSLRATWSVVPHAQVAVLPAGLTLGIRQLRRAERVDLGRHDRRGVGRDDPMTGYLCVPAPGRWPRWDIGAPLRHMVTSWASCYGTGGCASACGSPNVRSANSPRPERPASTGAVTKRPSVSTSSLHPGPELTRPDGGCAALPPALIVHRYGDDPALRSFPDEDIRCPQIFALVRLVSNGGRVAGRPHPGL
jgi:hypothetical protein